MSEELEEVLDGTQEGDEPTEPTGEIQDSTPETQDDGGQEEWSKKAYLDEKRKRQEYERQLEEKEQELAELQKAQQKEDGYFWEDQDQQITQLQSQHERDLQTLKLEMSQETMRMLHPDYDEKELEFVDMAKKDPSLSIQLQSARNPAKFVYDTVTKANELKELGSATDRIKELEAQIAKLTNQPNIPPSLANQRNASGGTEEPIDQSLEDIFDS